MLAAMSFAVFPSFDVAAEVRGEVRVIDGDTFDVGGTRVRLHGIDAPETDQPCTTHSGERWSCGAWVTAQTRAEFDGREAVCTPLDRDRYGRIVARCSVEKRDVGQYLVSEGMAFAYRRYSLDYDLDEKAAALSARGLHGTRIMRPSEYRDRRVAGDTPPDPDCVIKGNISGSGRIFHVPGQNYYNRTTVRSARGERWFCSEEAARAAGWRKARR